MKLTVKSITQLAVCLALTLAFTAQAEDKKMISTDLGNPASPTNKAKHAKPFTS